jgi:multisite-specific tRNA:(cytosine-C5)-methyltransferase
LPQKSARKNSRNALRVIDLDDEKRDDLLQKCDMKNSKFDAYYRKQLPLDDEEWSIMMDTFREPLPSTFRIAGGRECVDLSYLCRNDDTLSRTAAVLTSVMEKTYIPHLSGVVFEDQLVPPPVPIPW